VEEGEQGKARRVRVEITWASIFRVLIGILLAATAVALWPMFKLLVLAILIAVSLYPMVSWGLAKGWPRGVGLAIATSLLLLVAIGLFGFLGPVVFRETSIAAENVPEMKEEILSHLPASGWINRVATEWLNSSASASAQPFLSKLVDLSKTALMGVFNFGLILILSIYLMVDGPRLLKWLIVFFPKPQRPKISEALAEMSDLIVAYLIGQFITSALAAVYVILMLSILRVPMAILLGVVAGLFDVLPIIGFFLAVLPAMAMGLTVSTSTAVMVFVLYGAYHLFENYFIVPKVYGKRLELSTLAVLLAIMAAGLLAGVPGAIAILPFVAAYPAVERLFLANRLEPDTVRKHEQIKHQNLEAHAK
jgi:predicted PurR-regulated permease PerM